MSFILFLLIIMDNQYVSLNQNSMPFNLKTIDMLPVIFCPPISSHGINQVMAVFSNDEVMDGKTWMPSFDQTL